MQSPAFSRFWLAETITALGNQMLAVAVAWQTYELTDSALALGLIGLAQFAPVFVFALVAGHAADRYDRRRIALAVAGGAVCGRDRIHSPELRRAR